MNWANVFACIYSLDFCNIVAPFLVSSFLAKQEKCDESRNLNGQKNNEKNVCTYEYGSNVLRRQVKLNTRRACTGAKYSLTLPTGSTDILLPSHHGGGYIRPACKYCRCSTSISLLPTNLDGRSCAFVPWQTRHHLVVLLYNEDDDLFPIIVLFLLPRCTLVTCKGDWRGCWPRSGRLTYEDFPSLNDFALSYLGFSHGRYSLSKVLPWKIFLIKNWREQTMDCVFTPIFDEEYHDNFISRR